jgi:hypothetical protein
MYVTGMFMTGDAVFVLHSKGMERTIRTSLNWGKQEPKGELRAWDHIKWFKEGRDRGKYSTQEYRFLRVHFKQGAEWMITDNNGEHLAEFEAFLAAFKEYVEAYNSQVAPLQQAHTATDQQTPTPEIKTIEQRKTFYETIGAKIFTIILGVLIAIFLYLWATTSYVSNISAFRLFVVLIPGFIYVWYRVFAKKK